MGRTGGRPGFDWVEVLVEAGSVAVVAFVVLQIKEYVDAGRFDTRGTGVDALLVAGGVLILNVVLQLSSRRPKP